jgi:hypothetical protein
MPLVVYDMMTLRADAHSCRDVMVVRAASGVPTSLTLVRAVMAVAGACPERSPRRDR